MPHLDNEIEELAETQKKGRWTTPCIHGYHMPLRQVERMADKLNTREKYRNQVLPEKSNARRLSQTYAENGVVCTPTYKAKLITVTVLGFDGHPMHFRVHPMADVTLNTLIDGSGMNIGHMDRWQRCVNADCQDRIHGEGCLINVDLETLDRLPPPSRYEYLTLLRLREIDRPEISYNSRFSCQIPLTEELDGGLFALKQHHSKSLAARYTGWTSTDVEATIGLMRQRKVEPFAPYVEEPKQQTVTLSWDLLWAKSYQDFMKARDPKYQRLDGFHSRPETWTAYT
jgi:hypothetical protein